MPPRGNTSKEEGVGFFHLEGIEQDQGALAPDLAFCFVDGLHGGGEEGGEEGGGEEEGEAEEPAATS